ncbi:MAG: DEAD/DEAH box helicase [Legionellales bacterium]|jgi:ATP-dependent RNA helicase RhlE|nr:DEAD/DEAH box helicase [Legionellales bacterium]NDH66946.1 DEAD/DEAH box helicase [Gammaproteobacteria bacterium]
MNFEQLGLAEPLLQAIRKQGYESPSPIQQQAIPVILKGHDVLASAQTGTGKTGAFALPLIQRLMQKPKAKGNHTLALILTPTRELAAQVHASIVEYSEFLPLRSAVVYGGVKINPQMMILRGGVEILVATPGRLLDLYQQNAIRFEQIETLILDEADRMLDMGFIHDIKRIIGHLPRVRQNLLFSATFSDSIRQLTKGLLKDPVEVAVGVRNTAAAQVTQIVHPVDKARKTDLLCHLLQEKNWQQTLVFSRTKHGANKLVKGLAAANICALAIHGNKSQPQRLKALHDFKSGKVSVLVATDIAARGIDIEQLPLVINFDLPQVPEDYVHRIGRTGRAGHEGLAISLVSADESMQLHNIEKVLKHRLNRVEIDDFEPNHTVPVSHSPSPAIKKPGMQQQNKWQKRKSIDRNK